LMRRRPFQVPLSRFIGATPSSAAIFLSEAAPSSGSSAIRAAI